MAQINKIYIKNGDARSIFKRYGNYKYDASLPFPQKIVNLMIGFNEQPDEFAARLNVSTSCVLSWMYGNTKPNPGNLRTLVDISGFSDEYWDDDRTPPKAPNSFKAEALNDGVKWSAKHKDYYKDIEINGIPIHLWGATVKEVVEKEKDEKARFASLHSHPEDDKDIIEASCPFIINESVDLFDARYASDLLLEAILYVSDQIDVLNKSGEFVSVHRTKQITDLLEALYVKADNFVNTKVEEAGYGNYQEYSDYFDKQVIEEMRNNNSERIVKI